MLKIACHPRLLLRLRKRAKTSWFILHPSDFLHDDSSPPGASLTTWKLQTKAPEDFSSGAAIEGRSLRAAPAFQPARLHSLGSLSYVTMMVAGSLQGPAPTALRARTRTQMSFPRVKTAELKRARIRKSLWIAPRVAIRIERPLRLVDADFVP